MLFWFATDDLLGFDCDFDLDFCFKLVRGAENDSVATVVVEDGIF